MIVIWNRIEIAVLLQKPNRIEPEMETVEP